MLTREIIHMYLHVRRRIECHVPIINRSYSWYYMSNKYLWLSKMPVTRHTIWHTSLATENHQTREPESIRSPNSKEIALNTTSARFKKWERFPFNSPPIINRFISLINLLYNSNTTPASSHSKSLHFFPSPASWF